MEPLLFLVHRMPFPPNKGDKIRSYHLLRHLAERYAVHLGTFVDMPEDLAHVSELDALCASHHVETLDPRAARLRSVSGFLTGEALTLPYYRNATLQAWVRETVARHGIRKAVVFSAAMAQYVRDLRASRRARFRRRRLGQVDASTRSATPGHRHSSIAARANAAGVRARRCGEQCGQCVRHAGEADLFLRLAPDCKRSVHVIENGVNTDYFSLACRALRRMPPTRCRSCSRVPWTTGPTSTRSCGLRAKSCRSSCLVRRRRAFIVGMKPAPAVSQLAMEANVGVTGRSPMCGPTCSMRRSSLHRCALHEAFRTRSSRPWPWRDPS